MEALDRALNLSFDGDRKGRSHFYIKAARQLKELYYTIILVYAP